MKHRALLDIAIVITVSIAAFALESAFADVLTWGVDGILVTTIMGLVRGIAFILCGRNFWIVITAHSAARICLQLIRADLQQARDMRGELRVRRIR